MDRRTAYHLLDSLRNRVFGRAVEAVASARKERRLTVPHKGAPHASRGYLREQEKFVEPYYSTDQHGQRRLMWSRVKKIRRRT